MSHSSSTVSPVVPHVGTTGETLTYPHRWLGSVNPIHEPTNTIISTSTSSQPFLTTHGFSTTPIAIYTMHFEDGPRVKGQPKMFHANFTHPSLSSPITIDGKVYTHKAFSNQQAAYRKDRYGMMILSPTLCYTMHGVVDNEKKRQERIARELRIDGEEKCSRKKRRQVFKINDSAVMMVRDGWDQGDYPTYAFNTNATYTIAFYARDTANIISHTGVRYTHNEHDVFVHIGASHGGNIVMEEEEKLQVVPLVTRKRTRVIPSVSRKRRHSETSEDSTTGTVTPVSPVSPHSVTSSCVSPTSPDSHVEHEFPITDVSHQSFVSEKRIRVEEQPYAPYAVNPYETYVLPSIPPVMTSSTSTLPIFHPINSPLPLPSLDYFSSESMDHPFITYDDTIPDMEPSLISLPSLSTSYDFGSTSTSLFSAEMESQPWLM